MEADEKLLVLKTSGSNVIAPQNVTREMFINKAYGKVVDEEKSDESLSRALTLAQSSIGKQNYQEGGHPFSEPESARGTTTESESIPPSIKIISMEDHAVQCYDIDTIDANQTETLIITGSSFGNVHIWNYEMQKAMCSVEIPKGSTALSVKFIARKGWFVVGSDDGFIHVYNYKNKMQKITSFKVHNGYVYSLAIHPTKSYMLSACCMEIKLWDWDHRWFGWYCMQTFKEHSYNVRAVAFNPKDYNNFASASNDQTIKVWSLDSAKSKYTLHGHSHAVLCLDFFMRDGRQYLISGSVDKTAKIWDMQKKECIRTLEHISYVVQAVSHPNLQVLVTGTIEGIVYLWSSANFRLKRTIDIGGRSRVRGLACLNYSGRVVVAHKKGVSLIEIREEGQGSSNGNDENSISATAFLSIEHR